jgi:hypothetical protein
MQSEEVRTAEEELKELSKHEQFFFYMFFIMSQPQ